MGLTQDRVSNERAAKALSSTRASTHSPTGTRGGHASRQGLLGGSFDPVHLAHMALARHARDHLRLDKVTLIPAGSPWQRDALGATAEQRLEMLKLASGGHDWIDISRIEIDRNGPTYTIDTLETLPVGPEYFWILGADQLQNFCSWHRWRDIADTVQLAVANRPGAQLMASEELQTHLASKGRKLHVIPMPPMALSATAIRQRLASGQSVTGMLHPDVAQYIQRHGLYRKTAA